jgi:hypothetical protein
LKPAHWNLTTSRHLSGTTQAFNLGASLAGPIPSAIRVESLFLMPGTMPTTNDDLLAVKGGLVRIASKINPRPNFLDEFFINLRTRLPLKILTRYLSTESL